MSDKARIPGEVFIFFKLEGLKTALSDSPIYTENYLNNSFNKDTHPSIPKVAESRTIS